MRDEGSAHAECQAPAGVRPRIAVIGSSGHIDPDVERAAFQVGAEIARRGGILFTGGRDGVMAAASSGAKSAGGLTVGILPGRSTGEANEHIDIPITTGLPLDYRSLILVHTCDAAVMIAGGNGTLGELSAAYLNLKPVVVLTGTGEWADRIREFAYEQRYLDLRRNVELRFAATPAEAARLAVDLARSRPLG